MLRERAEQYYQQGKYNCAETILRAANEEYGLGLDERALKLVGGFGAGMGCGQTCGALCGGVCVISAMEIEETAMRTKTLGPKTRKLVAAFRTILGDTECKNLVAKYKKPGSGCLDTVLLGCDALEQALREE